jgi:Asp-tRNA(Asn)/Glu-tRNA(Gln) amidotransferase A subunit family amidase
VVEVVPAPARATEGPLLGTPVAVKDLIDVAGCVRGDGNPSAMLGSPATDDAPVVARLRAAAADVLATASLLEYAAGAPHPDLPEALNPVRPDRTAEALLDGVDVLLGPAAPFTAPELTPPVDTAEGEVEGLFSGPFNVTGQPAVTLPAGRSDEGLPFAVQLVGRRGADASLLAACAWIEQVLAG